MKQTQQDDDYLWDKSGVPDPEVQRLETLLAPLAHDGRVLRVDAGRRPGLATWVVAAALLVGAAVIGWEVIWGSGEAQLRLVVVSDGGERSVRQGDKFTPSEQIVLRLEDDLSEITLDAGSILYVDRLQKDLIRFRLERGRLHALVSAEAKERFFQIQTPSTNCVDLGCMYTLEVDDEQKATVIVELGRVAFEDGNRVVVVPAEATCEATKRNGAGTPRHLDTPDAVVIALDQYDANPGDAGQSDRLRMATRILAFLDGERDPRYSLIPWHLLQDPSPAISSAAGVWLMTNRAGLAPAGFEAVPGRQVSPAQRQAWRTRLEAEWGW